MTKSVRDKIYYLVKNAIGSKLDFKIIKNNNIWYLILGEQEVRLGRTYREVYLRLTSGLIHLYVTFGYNAFIGDDARNNKVTFSHYVPKVLAESYVNENSNLIPIALSLVGDKVKELESITNLKLVNASVVELGYIDRTGVAMKIEIEGAVE